MCVKALRMPFPPVLACELRLQPQQARLTAHTASSLCEGPQPGRMAPRCVALQMHRQKQGRFGGASPLLRWAIEVNRSYWVGPAW
jgi:hypothetical protein